KPPQAAEAGFDLQGVVDRLMGASDAQIAEKLRALLLNSKRLEKHAARPEERKAVESFYAARDYAPSRIKDGRLTGRAKAAVVRLTTAAAEGLDPVDYPVPEFGSLTGADAIAAAEIDLAASVIAFARHLSTGRIAPRRVTAEVEYGNHTPDAAE